MLVDNPLHERHAQSDSEGLRAEQRFEHAAADIVGHAATVVCDGEHQVRVVDYRGNGQFTFARR